MKLAALRGEIAEIQELRAQGRDDDLVEQRLKRLAVEAAKFERDLQARIRRLPSSSG